MKIQSKILLSVIASVAVAAVTALIAFSILRGMNTEFARIRAYDQIIGKTHALNILAAYLKEGSGQSDIRQVRGALRSLDDLLGKMTSQAPREEALIKQLQRNNSELGPLIDQVFVTGQGVGGGIEKERRNLLASQIWMKVRFISDDTDSLKDISDSRIISAQEKTGATLIALIIIMALTNGIIYFLSGRSIVRGQEALRESEERFRVTLGSVGDAVIATDASGLVTFLNPVAAKLTGWESGAASHQPIQNVFRIINEQTRQPAQNVVERVLHEGKIVNLANHTALITRDGREIPIEDSAAPIRDKDGGVCGVVLVFHDVTEGRRARQQIENIARFPGENPNPILRISSDGKLLYANRSSATLLESLGWKQGETLPGDWRQQALQTLGSGRSKEMELTCEEVVYSLLLVPVRDLGYLNIYGRDITERKRVEVELRESQSRLDLALRSAQMGVWRLDLIEDKRFFDDQVCRLLGIDPAKFTGTAEEFYKAVHPVDREALKAALARNIEQNLQYETEYRAVWPDGSVHYVTSRGKLVHDDKGRPVRVNGLIWDISERKRAEETLQTTVQRFHKILSNIFVGILVVTEDDQIEFANQDFCDQFDIAEPPSELIGLTAKEMLQKVLPAYADPEAYSARIKQILSQRRRIEDEEVLMRDGRVLLRDHIPILVDGKPHGRMWQHRDITERKRTEDELRESQQKNEFLADIIRIGSQPFVVGYPDGHLGLVNSAFEHLTGYSSDELQSIDWAIDLTPPEWLAIERQKLEEQLRTGKPIRYEKEYIRKDGSRAPIELLVHLVTDSDGMPQYYYSFLTDISERKRMEEELRESEAKYRTLFENMAEEVHFWRVVRDEAGLVKTWRLVDANPPTLDTWGRSSLDEIREKTTDEIFGPGAADHYMPVVQKIMTEGVPHSFEDYFPNLDKYFRFTSVPLGDYFITTGADITSIKKAEQVLRKAHDELEARVRERTAELVIANEDLQKQAALLNLSHDAIFVVDSAGVVSFWNSGAEDLYGFTREQAVENVAYEFLHTRFPESLAQVVSQVIDKGQWAGELRQTTSGGKELVVESRWALRRGDDGEPTGFLEVNRDITSRKIVEERLRRADRAFRTLSECNQAIVRQAEEMELLRQICRIVVEDGGYRMAWVGFAENDDNKTVRPVAYAGYDHGYLDEAKITWADVETGRGPTGTAIRTGEISISKDALSNPAFAPWRSEAAKRGFASSIAFPLIVDGQAVGALTIYAPEPDAFDEREVSFLSNLAENLAYGIASIRVAIQRRRSEEDLRVYAHRLEVINKELEDFAFIASHDLQEPLRKIQTFCDMAVKRCATVLDSTSQDYLERVVNSASRMRQLLSDLLMFSRVASRPEPFKRIDLSKIAREAADVFEAAIKETGAQVEIETMPGIEADGNQILRLFQNLIGNALKFRGADKPRIMVYAKQDRTGVCEIFVKDNGIGFDPQFAELIFKPFQRLHRRNEYEGTGMGLAICRKIVERHGGNISAGSEPGRGSTFVVRLPVKQDRWEGM